MDPTIEALTIHPAAWAAFLQGLAEGVAYGVAVVAGGLVVIVVSIACLGGRQSADDDLDGATGPVVTPVTEPGLAVAAAATAPRSLGGIVPMVWGASRVHGVRARHAGLPTGPIRTAS